MSNAHQRTAAIKQAQAFAARTNRELVVFFDPERINGRKWVGDYHPYVIGVQYMADNSMKGCPIVYRTS